MTKNYYNKHYLTFINATKELDLSFIYQKFEKYIKKGDHILDLGCGSGRDSLYFLKKGYKITSIDNSEKMVQFGSQHIGQQVINMDMLKLNFDIKFNAIWAMASILHIEKDKIPSVFNQCHHILDKNGVFYSSFKYGDDQKMIDSKIYSNFNEIEMENLINKTDFKLKDLWISEDKRRNNNTKWLNVIVIK